jgi:hypothetical protein
MTHTISFPSLIAAAAVSLAASGASAQIISSTDFSSGTNGWQGNGGAEIQSDGLNDYFRIPGVTDMFWFEYANNTNPDMLGDYGSKGDLLELSFDLKSDHITVFGNPVDRAVIFELRNYDLGDDFYPYASVLFTMGTVSGNGQDWTNYTLTFDPNSEELPAGWQPYGAEDSEGNWVLPRDVTFADLISGVDEVVIHSAELGFFYAFTNFDLAIDNITLRAVPAPGSLALLGVPALLAGRRRRR